MPQTVVHLPDGQNFTVTPVFAGLFFKSHELNTHHSAFPAGWTIVLHTEDQPADGDDDSGDPSRSTSISENSTASERGQDDAETIRPPSPNTQRKAHIHSFTRPTLQSDSLFISSISNPSNTEFKPAASRTRQIAMMLWVSMYWYFHQPAPDTMLPPTKASEMTPAAGRPRGEWRINIKRDGVFKGRNVIPKLERMGLIATQESAAGLDDDEGWEHMYVTKRMFWQIPGHLFLFTLQPTPKSSSYPGSPTSSRPGSPGVEGLKGDAVNASAPQISLSSFTVSDLPGAPHPMNLTTMPSFPIGPYFSSSHLPTYYPPGPLQYTLTNHVRHPIRPKPPRMGEVFYTRFVPSVRQYLSFRVASSSTKPVPYLGPVGQKPPEAGRLSTLSDTSLLQMWLSNPRVQAFWGSYIPNFLPDALSCRHSFPVIGLWDGVPFGYFEIYWVKEDVLGQQIGSAANDFDRGVHVFIGEEWARGRVQLWLTAIVHWMFCADFRTMSVCMEPRVDNARFIQHLQHAGFSKEKEITFPHKQAWFGRLRRDGWEGPAL